MKFDSLFPSKKVICFSCMKKIKDKDLAVIRLNCSDGVVDRKICKDCEKMFERNVSDEQRKK